jgi:hypothetical protein
MNQLKVRNIIEEKGEFSIVTVDSETFKQITGFRPALPYTTARTSDGKGVRIFTVEDANLYVLYTEDKKTRIAMKSEDAKKHFLPLAVERENGPKVDLVFS